MTQAWEDPGWQKAALEYHEARGSRRAVVEVDAGRRKLLHRLLDDDVSIDRAWAELNTIKGRAADSTVKALMFSLRSRGVRALDEPDTRRRIAELSDQQAIEVGTRLRKIKPEIAHAWTADEVSIFIQARESLK